MQEEWDRAYTRMGTRFENSGNFLFVTYCISTTYIPVALTVLTFNSVGLLHALLDPGNLGSPFTRTEQAIVFG